MDASKLIFRASQVGDIMSSESQKIKFTDTQIDKLIEIYNSFFYHRYEEIKSKYLTKGNEREEDSITLLSCITKKLYKKNEIRLFNEYVTCIADLYTGESIENADETIDIKTSWSKNTFDKARIKKLNSIYKWQGVTQMWLSGAKKHTVAYCLVNGTAQAIMDEKRKISWNYGPDPDVNEEYIEKCKQIEINHIFDMGLFKKENEWFEFHNSLSDWKYDIPAKDRVHLKTFDRNNDDILALCKRIKEGRQWINETFFNIAA